jgi:molecular chaperone DnaK
MSAKRVYGIDLGTTYSCIAHVDEHGKPVVLPNAESDVTTPSVVYFESPDNIVVGQAAKGVVSIHTDLCVSTIKRSMGDAEWKRTFFGQSYRPQDISSFILRKVAGDAEKIVGEKIENVVITCPAYFGVTEKEATKQAGVLAGLNVLYVIPEPTAAALAYGIEQTEDQVILVYDLGGGTFDITLIEIKGGDITVICTGGDSQLGGKDWDDAIVNHLTSKFEEASGTPAETLLEDMETYQELLNDAERCKKELSSRKSYTAAVRFGGERVKVDLSRETFQQITAPLLERTLSLTAIEIEKAAAKGYRKIDKLLLVGGSTYMPQVIEAVKNRFALEVRQFDPNQAVAKGAALFGYKCYLDEQIKIRIAVDTGTSPDRVKVDDVAPAVIEKARSGVAESHGLSLDGLRALVTPKITNVTSKSFGMASFNKEDREVVFNLILVDAPVPASYTEKFFTRSADQLRVDMRCMENQARERQAEVANSREVGTAVLEFKQALPQGSPVEVTFNLGPDGLLQMHSSDLTTGREVDVKFETAAIMSREEVAAAKDRNLRVAVG